MVLSRKPFTKEESVEEERVKELILKGGSSPVDNNSIIEQVESIKRIQLRIPLNHLKEIDALVKNRPVKVSRHTWIMEAIVEKLERKN